MYCKSCGASLKPGTKFCAKCGTVVETTALEELQCPKCGTINRPGAKFCRQDGTPLIDEPAPAAESERAAVYTAPATSPPDPVPVQSVVSGTRGLPGSLWLVIGAIAVVGAVGGGYWLYSNKLAPPGLEGFAQQPGESDDAENAARESGTDAVQESRQATTSSQEASPAPSERVDAPVVAVGERWVSEVVDHQDSSLNYRSERIVTDVGPDRIMTSIRTLGKDYVRQVEYDRQWSLRATYLQSGASTAYVPALPYLSFPAYPGKSWQARVVETSAEGALRVHEISAKIEGWERVSVPAGSFTALKVVLTDNISKDGMLVQQGQDVSWYAPAVHRSVKTEETSLDPTTGARRRRTISLIEYSHQYTGANRGNSSAERMIAVVPSSDVRWGSGCTHYLAPIESPGDYENRILLHWGYPISDSANGRCIQDCKPSMNIRGKTVAVEPLTQWPEDLVRNPKVGDRFTERYQADSISIQVDSEVTFACPPPSDDAESCEVLDFTGTMTASDGTRTETYQTVGQCGS